MVEQHIGSFVLPEAAQVFSSYVSFSREITQQKELKEREKGKLPFWRDLRTVWFFILFLTHQMKDVRWELTCVSHSKSFVRICKVCKHIACTFWS